jgi:lactoylglutathione lyase
MAEWEKQTAAINLIVSDLPRSAAFYQEVFGLPLQHQDEDTAMFRFKDTYVFLQRLGPPGRPVGRRAQQGTERCRPVRHHRLGRGRGARRVRPTGVVVISGPEDREWGMRTMTFADPGGNTWEIAQELPTNSAS